MKPSDQDIEWMKTLDQFPDTRKVEGVREIPLTLLSLKGNG